MKALQINIYVCQTCIFQSSTIFARIHCSHIVLSSLKQRSLLASRQYEVGTQQQQQQPQPVPVISNNVPNTNQNQLIPIAPPANTANNGQGKVIATSTNRGQSNSAITTVCSIADGCCSSGDCPTTGCCNFQYGCVDEPTDLPWMTQYLEDFCM